jgi:hypothetical protein
MSSMNSTFNAAMNTYDSAVPHAAGGRFVTTHLGLIAEQEPETIVPDSTWPDIMGQRFGDVHISVSGAGDPKAVAREVAREFRDMQRVGRLGNRVRFA